jgi:four helix bundle suffix protein
MLDFCRQNNDYAAYQPLAEKLSAEEFCNMALTVCHFTDKMFDSYLKHLEERFKEDGGIKERMHAVRTGYRQKLDTRMKDLEEENNRLRTENAELKRKLGIV